MDGWGGNIPPIQLTINQFGAGQEGRHGEMEPGQDRTLLGKRQVKTTAQVSGQSLATDKTGIWSLYSARERERGGRKE